VTLHPDTARMHRRGWLTAAAVTLALLAGAAPAAAQSGGTGTGDTGDGGGGGGDTSAGGGVPPAPTTPGANAELLPNGDAVPPAGAPPKVARAIKFANRINKKPYVYGGGHQSWRDKGYDCSGAVSYMLHGAKILDSPIPSGALAKWGTRGEGQWITVYANKGHTYAVVAGLRWDTSGGKGPRWHEDMRSSSGYKIRHYEGF
jgi:cell wall-associated NlpC family hydrolase